MYPDIYRDSPSTKAFLLGVLVGILTYCIVSVMMFIGLSAGAPRPGDLEHTTHFPAHYAFIFALFYAVPAALVVFITAAVVFSLIDFIRRRRRQD